MKKILLIFAALGAALSLSAQSIRTNYRSEGMTHISTDYEKLEDFEVRVELVGFPDSSWMYQLFIDLRQKTSFSAPKGVKMTATLPGGSVVRADQIGRDSATMPRLSDGMYLNRLRYALETGDMDKLTRGVTALELVTGWDPDDYLQYNFRDDAFGRLLKRHCEVIRNAQASTIELAVEPAGRVDQAASIMTAANPIVASGTDFQYNIILNHLYYKNSILPDTTVTFLLEDGTEITLPQTRDDVNFIYLYPSLEQLRTLAYGRIAGLRIQTEDGTLSDAIPDKSFSEAINQQYQLLMSLSER